MVEKKLPVGASAQYRIFVNPDICAGCNTCEAVCSLYKEGVSSPHLSRIQVLKDPLDGYISEPAPCMQCDVPWCLLACPADAFHVDEATGAKVLDEEKCSGCMLCMTACPASPKRIRYNADKKVCLKCDLCGGDPQCVRFCPTGALTYTKV